MVAVRGFFYNVVLVAVTFFVAYLVNMVLIFKGTPEPWSQYTGLLVTAMAFMVACVLIFMAKKGKEN